jgi:hypothetical protein
MNLHSRGAIAGLACATGRDMRWSLERPVSASSARAAGRAGRSIMRTVTR